MPIVILSLPTEVIMEVFKSMGWRDILHASQVSFGGTSLISPLINYIPYRLAGHFLKYLKIALSGSIFFAMMSPRLSSTALFWRHQLKNTEPTT